MKKIIALLDKENPPNHSFVDGMLATALPEKDIKVNLIVSGTGNNSIYRYKRAVCLPLLYPRNGVYRILNFFKVVFLLSSLIKKNNKYELTLFVRNDPVYLLACAVVKKKGIKIIFQNSFPHEKVSGSFIKRSVAVTMYKIGADSIDSVLAVSSTGLERVKKIFPKVKVGTYIPLASDANIKPIFHKLNENEMVKFIYLGDHSKPRKLNFVLEAIYDSYLMGINAKFIFIGAKSEEIKELRLVKGVLELESVGILVFKERITRERIWNELKKADIGLCLIPPDEHYIESSPTKLSEYMGVGLAVLANTGIPLQEEFIQKSAGGILVEWNQKEISKNLISLSINKFKLLKMQKNAHKYVLSHLNYDNYVKEMESIL